MQIEAQLWLHSRLTRFPDDDNTTVNGSAFASTDERSDRAEINSCQTLTHAYFDLFLCDVYGLFYSYTSLRCALLPRNSSLLDRPGNARDIAL